MKAKKKATKKTVGAKTATAAKPEVMVSVTGPAHVCDAAVMLLRAVFAHLGYRMGDIRTECGEIRPAKRNAAPKHPAGRPVKKSEIRQWKSWRKKGASFGEIARRAGRPRSVVTKYVQATDTGGKCGKVLK